MLPPDAGTDLYVRASAKEVFGRLPDAVRLAGLDWKGADKEGPPDWLAIALVGASFGTDGSWMRIVVEDAAPGLAHVSAISRPRGGGLFASYDTPPRNVLLSTLLVNNPAVKTDAIKPIKRPDQNLNVMQYQDLARAAMAPLSNALWSKELAGSNAAFIAPIDGRGLLVASTAMKSIGANPHACAPRIIAVALHEFGTGKELWKRDLNLRGSLSLISARQGLVLQSSNQLLALDAATGKSLWTFSHQAAASVLDDDATHIALWNREIDPDAKSDGKKNANENDRTEYKESLVVVSLADGKLTWKAELEKGKDAGPRELLIQGKRVYAIDRTVGGYDLETGRKEGRVLAAMKPPIKHLVGKDRVLFGDASGTVACVGSDGTERWRRNLESPIDYMVWDNDDLLVAGSRDTEAALRLLSLKTGEPRWERRDALLAGNAVFTGGVLAYSTRERVVLLDRTSGSEIATAPRSAAMRKGDLPDRLIAYNDRLAVAGETGVMALSLGGTGRRGETLWQIDLRGVDQSFSGARQDQARRALYNYGLAPQDWSFYGAGAYAQTVEKMHADATLTQALTKAYVNMADYQASLNRKERETLSHPDPGGRYSGLTTGDRLRLLQANIDAERSQALANTSVGMAFGAIGMADSYIKQLISNSAELVKAQVLRSQESVNRATQLWAQSLQGDYFVRPIGWEFGSGVLVLNLRSGNWKELISGPGEPAVQDFYLQDFPAVLDSDGRHLYTMTQNGTQLLAEIPGYVVRSRTAAAFALENETKWHAPQEYDRRSLAPRSALDGYRTGKL